MSYYDFDTTAANNSSVAGMNWAEGQAPSTVNNSARQLVANLAALIGDIGGGLEAGGTANALTVTANDDFSSYDNGHVIAFKAAADNTGAATLSVNGIGAKSIRRLGTSGEEALSAGDIKNGWVYIVRYSTAANSGAGAWLLDWAPKVTPPVATDFIPVGSVQDYAGSTAPSGWLLCYGQAVSRTTYEDLFDVIGTTYGVGDSSTTFNLPDLRGRVVAGKDDMGGTSSNRLTGISGGVDGDGLGNTGGVQTHTLTETQIPSHTHDAGTLATGNDTHTHNVYGGTSGPNDTVFGVGSASAVGVGALQQTTGNSYRSDLGGNSTQILQNDTHNHTITGSTGSIGSGGAHNNVQPTIILNKIIFAGV